MHRLRPDVALHGALRAPFVDDGAGAGALEYRSVGVQA